MLIDKDGRTLTERLGRARLESRDVSELIGLCKGCLADGVVNLAEAQFMLTWLEDHRNVTDLWPANNLYDLLDLILEDGNLSSEGESTLLGTLAEITGHPVRVQYTVSDEKGRSISTRQSKKFPGRFNIFNNSRIRPNTQLPRFLQPPPIHQQSLPVVAGLQPPQAPQKRLTKSLATIFIRRIQCQPQITRALVEQASDKLSGLLEILARLSCLGRRAPLSHNKFMQREPGRARYVHQDPVLVQ